MASDPLKSIYLPLVLFFICKLPEFPDNKPSDRSRLRFYVVQPGCQWRDSARHPVREPAAARHLLGYGFTIGGVCETDSAGRQGYLARAQSVPNAEFREPSAGCSSCRNRQSNGWARDMTCVMIHSGSIEQAKYGLMSDVEKCLHDRFGSKRFFDGLMIISSHGGIAGIKRGG